MKETTKTTRESELIGEISTGLLGWYPFRKGARALYIGRPEDPMALMLRDTKGLELKTAGPEELPDCDTTTGYDYIVCIAHLEKIQDLCTALKRLKEMLAEKGTLLLGMNNRLGIRYFCGDSDRYTGGVLDGVENYCGNYTGPEDPFAGRTYARAEIEDMLDKAGMGNRKFYSVLSDLDNPVFLFADGYIPNEDLSNRVFPSYNYPQTVFLDERKLYGTLLDNDLFHKMANAFLIECSDSGQFSDALHVTGSLERGRDDSMYTVVHSNGTVTKEAAFPEGRERLNKLIENSGKLNRHGIMTVDSSLENGIYIMPFIKAPNGQLYLKKRLYESKESFLEALDHFRDLIMRSSETYEKTEPSGEKVLLLKECMFDMVPLNTFFIDGEFYFFDQEFCLKDYPVNVMLTRMIVTLYMGDQEMYKLIPQEELFRRYGIWETRQRWHDMELEFLSKLRKQEELSGYHSKVRLNNNIVNANRERMNYSSADHERIFINIFRDVDVKKLVLFGSGKYAQRFAEKYAEDHPVYAIADNNETRWGEEPEWLPGVRIVSPKIFSEIDKDICKVIVCIRDYKPILKQLDALGIRDYCVYDPNRHYTVGSRTVIRMGDKTQSTEETEGHYHIGYVAGAFDMFHIGHLNLIRRAKERCDYLIAGVMSDERMFNLKKKYPVIPCRERMQVVAGCRYVDEVVELSADRAGIMDAYNMLHYDCMFSGDDHASDPVWLAERERLRQHGSDLIFVSYTKDTSSTEIRERLK